MGASRTDDRIHCQRGEQTYGVHTYMHSYTIHRLYPLTISTARHRPRILWLNISGLRTFSNRKCQSMRSSTACMQFLVLHAVSPQCTLHAVSERTRAAIRYRQWQDVSARFLPLRSACRPHSVFFSCKNSTTYLRRENNKIDRQDSLPHTDIYLWFGRQKA